MEEALPKGKIKMESNWHQWCRLCAGDYPDNINLSSIDPTGLVMAIGKYFWVDIKVDDGLSQCLCRECQKLVEYLIKFSELVHRVQRMYGKLHGANPGSNLNNDEIRKECADWVHMIPCQRSPQNPELTTMREIEEMDGTSMEDFLIIEEHSEEAEGEEDLKEKEQEIEKQKHELIEEEEFQEQYEEDQEHDDEDQEEIEEIQEQDEDDQEQDIEDLEDELNKYEMEVKNIAAEIITEFDDETEDEDNTSNTFELDSKPNISFNNIPLEEAGVKEYTCKLCPKVYKKPMAYKRHMATMHGSYFKYMTNYQCQHCDNTFSTVNQLTAHYRTHMTIIEKKSNSCPMCSKLFTTAGALNRHIAGTHKKITPYVCDICGKAVKTLGSLKDHMLVHTDACPFECNVCHRRFKNKSRLRVHSDSHTEGYDCDICGMRLKTRRTLNTHRQVHSDERKCKCEVCGATFKRTKTLKSHLILHTGIRPYKCNFCGTSFANGSNCRMHKRKKHPKELAEEESRRVIRSTRLPLIDDLNEASKRIKTPAKKPSVRTQSTKTKSINPSRILEENEDILNELVGEM